MDWIEIFGYIGMFTVLISMTLHNIKNLRIANSLSGLIFFFYGIMLHAYPIIIMNALIIVMNLYRLKRGN